MVDWEVWKSLDINNDYIPSDYEKMLLYHIDVVEMESYLFPKQCYENWLNILEANVVRNVRNNNV